LRKRGLALPSNKEFKQRAIIYQISNIDYDNKAKFNNIYRIFRLGLIYNKLIEDKEFDKATREDLIKNMNYIKMKSNKNDLAKIEKFSDLINTR